VIGAAMEPKKTVVPARVVSTIPVAGSTENTAPTPGPSPLPSMEISSPGAMGPTRLVAEFSMAAMTIAGGVAETTRLTEIVWGLFDAPAAVTVIAPWYVFTANPEVLTKIVIAPPSAEAVSHAEFDTTEYARLPPPAFVTETVCGGGVVPPTVYAKLRLEAEAISREEWKERQP